jgi:hypothetical protein
MSDMVLQVPFWVLVVKMPQDASASDYSQGIASELCGLFIGGIVGAVVSIRVAHKK